MGSLKLNLLLDLRPGVSEPLLGPKLFLFISTKNSHLEN